MAKKLRDIEVDDFLAECVAIEPLALQEEYVRLPADLAYWNAKYADAFRKFSMHKIQLDKTTARLTIEHRERIQMGGMKATEATVGAAVETDQEYLTQREEMVLAEVEKVRLYGVLEAIRAKRDMLISLGAHIRAEMVGDPVLRDQMAQHNRGR